MHCTSVNNVQPDLPAEVHALSALSHMQDWHA